MKYIIKIEIDNVLRNTELENKLNEVGLLLQKKYSLSDCVYHFGNEMIIMKIDNTSTPDKAEFKNFIKLK